MTKTVVLAVLLVLVSCCSLFVGVANLNLAQLIAGDQEAWNLFFASRIPRLIAILMCGAGLSICGLIMQQITNNKFVSPTTAGTISFAKLGILISLAIWPSAGLLTKAGFAIVTSIIGSVLFMQLLRSLKFTDIIFVPLMGLVLGRVVDSITEFYAYKYNLLQIFSAWLQGNFSLIIEGRFEILYISLPLIALAYLYANRFSIVGMGKENAENLGVNYQRILNLGLFIVSLITAIIVVIAGNIPFIGLIVPNIVSLYLGDNMKHTLVFTALFGALFVLCCDIISRTVIFPFEMSVGAVIGLIGSLIFIYLIYRRYRHG